MQFGSSTSDLHGPPWAHIASPSAGWQGEWLLTAAGMEVIPAIDLLDGKVVRLEQGDYQRVTVYDADPVALAQRFAEAGAKRLHVVDLEGARRGSAVHTAVIEAILRATSMAIQVGGGVRDAETARRWWQAGAERVVLGTAAVRQPDLVQALCTEKPGGVVVAIDAKHGEVAVEGWLQPTGLAAHELARQVDAWGAAAILFTAIERDGMRQGPDVAATAALQATVRATVIASGGVGSLADLQRLHAAGVRAAVCGRALVSGEVHLAALLAGLASRDKA